MCETIVEYIIWIKLFYSYPISNNTNNIKAAKMKLPQKPSAKTPNSRTWYCAAANNNVDTVAVNTAGPASHINAWFLNLDSALGRFHNATLQEINIKNPHVYDKIPHTLKEGLKCPKRAYMTRMKMIRP